MKKTILIILSILVFGCKSELKQKEINLGDLNLILQTNEDIDSVMITDIGQQRENHKVAFKDTIKVNLNDSINDLFNIWFFKDDKMVSSPLMSSQLWLNGENIIIKGEIDKKLIIDTIIGSDLYYKAKKNQEEFRSLFANKADSSEINSFLIKNIQNNFDNPFSLILASNYIYRNQNNKTKLKELYYLIVEQNNLVKNHSFFDVHRQLQKKLQVTNLNIEDYKFYNIENEIVKFEFKKEKKYLLDLWFVNCPPCVKDHKVMAKKLQLLENKNIELIGISIDREHTKWKKYLQSNNYNWLNLREIVSSKTITEDLGISAYPTYILIENGGEIKTSFNSFVDIENYLSKK